MENGPRAKARRRHVARYRRHQCACRFGRSAAVGRTSRGEEAASVAGAFRENGLRLGACQPESQNPPASKSGFAPAGCGLHAASGRKRFSHRRVFAAANTEEVCRLLSGAEPNRVFTGQSPASLLAWSSCSPVRARIREHGRELYETEPIFRAQLDACAERLTPDLGLDLRTLLYPPSRKQPRRTRDCRARASRSPHYSASNTRWRSGGWHTASRQPPWSDTALESTLPRVWRACSRWRTLCT